MNIDPETLLIKYFEGTATSDERALVEQWKDLNPDNNRIFRQYRKLWEVPEKLNRYNTLTEASLQTVKQQIPGFRKTRRLSFLKYAAAAVLGLLIVSAFLIYSYSVRREKTVLAESHPVMEKVRAVSGMVTRLTLSDGSEVTLFPGSEITFPTRFTGGTRSVHLTGEGFFRVTHNSEKPFIVKTNQLDVEVLGTVFNVRTASDGGIFETVLVEGSVRLQEHNKTDGNALITMLPNQRVLYDSRKKKIEVHNETDLEKYIAWTEGRLVFDADSLNEVIRKLETWYNVRIIVKNKKLENYVFTGKFSDEPIEKVLKLLQLTSDFKFKIHSETLNRDGYFSKKIIELY